MKLPKAYEPKLYENDIYALWEKSGAFAPNKVGKSYGIVMPPPNANGNLHIGHELTAALEDIAARYHRSKGESVLLLPGADHAGFETQSVYEKQLAKEGKSRFDFSREELYSQIWDFVALNRENFETQLRRMGVSCDWQHFTYTLDKKIIDRAYKTFQKMWNEGLIYRGERLVNFCTFHGTAFADIEVVHKEDKGHLWHLRYPLVDGSGEVVVATTRPETMLGDTAVAVNPEDKRYKELIGKTVKLPLTQREIPILADDFVDMKFGTGAVKVTPAHDPNDYAVPKVNL
jgi:valyl-tRNA synthetase